MLKCLRCQHEWIQRNTNTRPKRCPKCKSYLWEKDKMVTHYVKSVPLGDIPPGGTTILKLDSDSSYDMQRLIAQIDTLHNEVAEKQTTIEELLRLPRTTAEPLEVNLKIHIPPKLYNQLKSHLAIAMRDKYPQIDFEVKDGEIIEIV